MFLSKIDFDQEGNVKPFRYTVAPKAKVNVFDPKPLESGLDPMAARYSQMGAHFIGKFHQLSCAPTALCKMLWEVGGGVKVSFLDWRRLECFELCDVGVGGR